MASRHQITDVFMIFISNITKAINKLRFVVFETRNASGIPAHRVACGAPRNPLRGSLAAGGTTQEETEAKVCSGY